MSVTCVECDLVVASKANLAAHWRQKRHQGKRHYHCSDCMRLFHTLEAETQHRQKVGHFSESRFSCLELAGQRRLTLPPLKFHAVKQGLACPDCGELFSAGSVLLEHIKNRCDTVDTEHYVALGNEKPAIAGNLQGHHQDGGADLLDGLSLASLSLASASAGQQQPHNSTQIPSGIQSDTSDSTFFDLHSPAANTGWSAPFTPSMAKTAGPPKLEGKQVDDLTSDDGHGKRATNKTENAWIWGKKLFPDAPPAVRPPPERQALIEEQAGSTESTEPAWPPHDPRNPRWNPRAYYVTYTDKYKCPHKRCPKSFRNVAGIRGHLLSPAHNSSVRVQCPVCSKWFDDREALVSHAESQSARCGIRKNEGFHEFLDQAMGDTPGERRETYTAVDEAAVRFGASERE